VNNQDESATSGDTVKVSALHKSQRQDADEKNIQIDTETKSYLDTNLIGSVENNSQINKNNPSTKQHPEANRTHIIQATSTNSSRRCRLREVELDEVKSVKYKLTNRKLLALSYVSLKPLSNIQGMTNKDAI
ncbi:15318_t:CDS:2, partial [Cetraspora pellucida]